MPMGKINQLKMGVILTYINMGLGSIIPIFYTPIMLRILGQEEYGLYSLSSSVISYLTLLSFGLGGTIVRYIAKYRAEEKKKELEKIVGLAILMYSFLAIVVMAGGIFLGNNVEFIFHKGLIESELLKIKPLIWLMAFNTAISFPISVFSSIIVAYEKYIYRQIVNIFSTIFAPCANLIALYLGLGSIGLAITTTILQFLMLPMLGGYCAIVLKVKPSFNSLPLHIVRELVGFSLFVFLGSLVDMLFWATDKVVLGMLAGTGIVAVYNVGSQFVSMLTNLSTAFSGVLVPKTTVMVARKASKNELNNLFIRVGRLQYIIIALAISGFILYGENFIILWAGKEYTSAYFVALLTMVPLVVPLIQNTGYSILLALNKHKFRSIIYLIIAIVNVISTYIVVPYLGAVGAAFCSGVSYIIGQGIIMNFYYAKVIGLNILKFWSNIIRMSIVPAIMLIVGIGIKKYVVTENWSSLLLQVCIYTLIYTLLMYKFAFNEYEKEIVKKFVRKIFNRLK